MAKCEVRVCTVGGDEIAVVQAKTTWSLDKLQRAIEADMETRCLVEQLIRDGDVLQADLYETLEEYGLATSADLQAVLGPLPEARGLVGHWRNDNGVFEIFCDQNALRLGGLMFRETLEDCTLDGALSQVHDGWWVAEVHMNRKELVGYFRVRTEDDAMKSVISQVLDKDEADWDKAEVTRSVLDKSIARVDSSILRVASAASQPDISRVDSTCSASGFARVTSTCSVGRDE